MHNTLLFILLTFFGISAAAFAAGEMGEGDPKAGAALYEGKCLVCHGVAGASVIPTQPILAGQHAHYLADQLLSYKDGRRKSPIMTGQVAGLSQDDINNVAHYLSEQPPVIAGADPSVDMAAGKELYLHGDIARGVPACTACHGATGEGISPTFPRVSGQHAVYIESSLQTYTSKERESVFMNPIAEKLTAEEMASLAAYISGLSF